jgi:hypothetical protein
MASSARYAFGAALIILPLWLLARRGTALSLFEAVLVLLIMALPVWMTISYLSAIRKAHATAVLRRPVWWGALLSGHGLRMVLALIPAFAAGLGMIAAILVQGPWVALWILGAGGLIFVSAMFIRPRAARDLRTFAQGSVVIWFSVTVTAVFLTLAALIWSARPSAPDSVSALLAADSVYTGSSAVVALIADWATFLTGAQAMAEHAATGYGLPLWVIAVWHALALFSYHFGLALAMAAPLLMSAEARRILAPSDTDSPTRVPIMTVALASVLATILAIATLQILARLEMTAQLVAAAETNALNLVGPAADTGAPEVENASDARPLGQTPSPLSPAGLMRQIEADVIGNLQCAPGTIAAIEAMDREFTAILATQQDNLRTAIETGFDGARANVPVFLDWYYSLSAEYLRTYNLLVGNGVDYLNDQFSIHLDTGAPLARIDATVAATLSANQLLADLHLENRGALLASCSLALPQDDVQIVVTGTRPDTLLTSNLHIEAISLETRLAAAGLGGVSGLVSGAIMAKIAAKAITSGVFKAAAGALVKIAGSKAISLGGGILIGGGSGAAGGSVVPGVGTTAGAIVGSIAGGIAVMLGVDFTLLKLDEEISRSDFEAEIIASIDAAEAELLVQLGIEPR